MAKKKASSVRKVTRGVVKAARAVAATADEYVVKPVGKALGLKKKPARKKAAASKTGAKSRTATTSKKKTTAKAGRK
jgi:hypothetical protein